MDKYLIFQMEVFLLNYWWDFDTMLSSYPSMHVTNNLQLTQLSLEEFSFPRQWHEKKKKTNKKCITIWDTKAKKGDTKLYLKSAYAVFISLAMPQRSRATKLPMPPLILSKNSCVCTDHNMKEKDIAFARSSPLA